MVKEVLKPYGSLDVLYFYSQVSKYLKKFLKGREIATKTHLPKGIPFFLKRGSKDKPLFVEDMKEVNEKMLKLRARRGLGDVRKGLKDKQELIWKYFVPRKLIQYFYATNGEKPGRSIDRVFIDIDRQKHTADEARRVALELVQIIKKDKELGLKFKIIILWTGSSFHVLLDLNKKINLGFYNTFLSYGKRKEKSFIMKWAKILSEKTGIKVVAGHEKRKDAIILDSSNTPSGKLARTPFSLHIKNAKQWDGICLPVSEKQLADIKLIGKLKKLSLEKVLRNIRSYSKLLV